MTFQLELVSETVRDHTAITMLANMVIEGYANQEDQMAHLSCAAAMCLGHAWSISPKLQGYRSPERGPLHATWHMKPDHLGSSFMDNIRIHDNRPMCNRYAKREALACFSSELCFRFRTMLTVLTYHFNGTLTVPIDLADSIEQLRLFDFMLTEVDTAYVAENPADVMEWGREIKDALKAMEHMAPSKENIDTMLKIGHDVLGLGAAMLFLLTPSRMPDSTQTEWPPQ